MRTAEGDLEPFQWALVTQASIAFEFISKKGNNSNHMKPDYGAHNDRATLPAALSKQSEVYKERPPTQEARAEQTEIPLPGLSVTQTEFFYRLRECAARWKMLITIAPDGEMSVRHGGDRESHSWGNIHDE